MKLLGIIFLFLSIPFSNAQQLKEAKNPIAPSREILTALKSAVKIVFQYDAAGNQTNITYKVNTPSDIFLSKDNDTVPVGKSASIEIYPNPATQLVRIACDLSEGNKIAAIRLIATLTRVAKKLEFETTGNRVYIDVSQFPTGVYVLEIAFNNAAILKHELIKI